jgi:hypothetical protein
MLLIKIVGIILYALVSRYLILNIKNNLFRRFAGPILGGIPIVLMGWEIIDDSFSSFILTFPTAIYLALLPAYVEYRGRVRNNYF